MELSLGYKLVTQWIQTEAGTPEANQYGFVGKKAMVTFRATRLFDKLGRQWHSRFQLAKSVAVADNVFSYEKLLQGVDEVLEQEVRRESKAAV